MAAEDGFAHGIKVIIKFFGSIYSVSVALLIGLRAKFVSFLSENARISGIFGICPAEHSLSIHPGI